MSALASHILLFLALSAVIVVLASFYADADDAVAFHKMPRRYVKFVLGCAVVALVMLALEHFFASVS
ncbi:MAG: hypothetical protein O7B99_15750 [Planctomycetota bacterium]|nr:hypothetical protein [Planctomycetota bacterium]